VRALWADPEVRCLLWDGQVVSRRRVAEVLHLSDHDFAERGYGYWGLRLKLSRELIGCCALGAGADDPEPRLSYALLPAYWGRGLATEAAAAVLGHAFERLGCPAVVAECEARNRPALRVLERLGMRLERPHGGHLEPLGPERVVYRLGRPAP
jgi:RimJ/RimL family protein N-acetyltransferase